MGCDRHYSWSKSYQAHSKHRVIFRNGGPECGIRTNPSVVLLQPDWLVHQFHIETDFSLHEKNIEETPPIKIIQTLWNKSSLLVSVACSWMYVARPCDSRNETYVCKLDSSCRHEAVCTFDPSTTVYSSSAVKVVWWVPCSLVNEAKITHSHNVFTRNHDQFE